MNEPEKKQSIFKKPWMQSLIAIVVIFGALIGFLYWQSKSGTVLIEDSLLKAPMVQLSPTSAGTLNALYVKPGDTVAAGAEIALVGTNVVSTKEAGIISDTPEALGGYYTPGQRVATLVVNGDMEVVGTIDETKGLDALAVGQRATFTVDAFKGKTYSGVVDEIAPSAVADSVIFSISDTRATQQFDVKVRFDESQYPELKSGMSAKITVHTK